MAKALKDIPWSEVRAICVADGYRAAAEAYGLKEGTIRQRASREGWFEHPAIKEALAKRRAVTSAVTTCNAPSAAVTIAEGLNDLNRRTRLALAKGIASGADHVAVMDGEEVFKNAERIGHLTRGAGTVHGWRDAEAVAIHSIVLPSNEAIMAKLREIHAIEAEEPPAIKDAAVPVEGRVD